MTLHPPGVELTEKVLEWLALGEPKLPLAAAGVDYKPGMMGRLLELDSLRMGGWDPAPLLDPSSVVNIQIGTYPPMTLQSLPIRNNRDRI
jgi:hypothetical protein